MTCDPSCSTSCALLKTRNCVRIQLTGQYYLLSVSVFFTITPFWTHHFTKILRRLKGNWNVWFHNWSIYVCRLLWLLAVAGGPGHDLACPFFSLCVSWTQFLRISDSQQSGTQKKEYSRSLKRNREMILKVKDHSSFLGTCKTVISNRDAFRRYIKCVIPTRTQTHRHTLNKSRNKG